MTALALALDSEDDGSCADAVHVDLPPSMVVESRTMPVVSLGKGRSLESLESVGCGCGQCAVCSVY